jgi:hypothetical protein
MAKRNIHLVGSMGLEDAETVFRTLARIVGPAAARYPDGETGARSIWIRWQRAVFDAHPDMELVEQKDMYGDQVDRPYFAARDGVDPARLTFDALGYADAATASFAIFRRLKTDGVIPAATRFQVSLPSPVAVTWGFIEPAQCAAIEPAYARAMAAEIDAICGAIPADELAIQWDVCQEVVAADGGLKLYYDDVLEQSLTRLARLGGMVPEPVQLGFHLCYGDPGHKHIIEPADLATCVAYANGITERVARPVDWIHMPVPRDRDDDAYFAPLGGLALAPDTELVLGLIHLTGGVDAGRRRLETASRAAPEFAIATECGLGRRAPETIAEVLQIHAEIASADG